MVHIKRLELSHFKSFGGTTQVPLLSGFTVVSGPNGSGKSNILDALLFALGLASSKGMRAERLPDLVNHNQPNRGHSTREASVTVTFDLEQESGLGGSEFGVRSSELEEKNAADGDRASLETLGTTDPHFPNSELPTPDDPPSRPNSELRTPNSELRTDREWSVTRKLRVTQQGTYTSTYYINGVPCTLTELHEQLNQLRVYPEGYNVVLQGDVTSIISMNPRERREIIDELAGVATFDRRIGQAKETLDEVKDREDRCRIIEKELIAQRDRLAADRLKAEKYQKLRTELQQKQQWEAVLVWRSLQQQQEQLIDQIQSGDRTAADLTTQRATLAAEIQQTTAELDQLNRRVRALGEDSQLALQSTLATQEAERRQLDRFLQELETTDREADQHLQQTQAQIQQHNHSLAQLRQEHQTAQTQAVSSHQQRNEAQLALNESRTAASVIADASDAWIQQQTALNRQIETLLQTLEPQRTEQALLQERQSQLERQLQEQSQLIQSIQPEIADKQSHLVSVETLQATSLQEIESLTHALAVAEQDLQLQQETQKRLLNEQRDKQRALDKLEAQAQALQETQGTYSTKVILQSGMSGICGLVAQLGRVEPRYQLALETAAGGRLGQLVVEDDAVAAAAIELLKQKRAGRATFLPLNKLRTRNFEWSAPKSSGFIDYAVNLVDCDNRYLDVFTYVFGNTIVFEALGEARRFVGQYRIVTLEGELLETSGAMTGGSSSQRSSLHFGTSDATESDEASGLRNRVQDIERILERCGEKINSLFSKIKQLTPELNEAKARRREDQLRYEQMQKEIKSLASQLEQTRSHNSQTTQELAVAHSRLQMLDTLPAQEAQLQQLRQALMELEQSQTNSQWQQIQATIKSQEQQLQEREQILRQTEQRLKDLENTATRTQDKIQQCEQRQQEHSTQKTALLERLTTLSNQHSAISTQIAQTQAALSQLEQTLGTVKQERDGAEQQLRQRHLTQQELEFTFSKLQETQLTRREELAVLQSQLAAQRLELPEPLPEVPSQLDLEQLQRELRSLSKRLQAMEPVNMLALEEYDRTQNRLEELSQKLLTLEAERTELLLRIENFTTLRRRAFTEAFDAVNENFQTIFATLSEGDGYLQLDDPEDLFNSGLNLVAHPKGKPVQRLASMSGGEKSLTALSFIFALQRYRPSPFYAFDEVDMFLDGANVERLARMIKQQAQQAQFIVVSLRRPMIESAERTIGVTQARGAYTQVLGLKLQSSSKSV